MHMYMVMMLGVHRLPCRNTSPNPNRCCQHQHQHQHNTLRLLLPLPIFRRPLQSAGCWRWRPALPPHSTPLLRRSQVPALPQRRTSCPTQALPSVLRSGNTHQVPSCFRQHRTNCLRRWQILRHRRRRRWLRTGGASGRLTSCGLITAALLIRAPGRRGRKTSRCCCAASCLHGQDFLQSPCQYPPPVTP